MSIRVRMAPSPTGDPHLGFIRTALFDYLLYRQGGEGSSLILRIEDTDQNRLVEGSVAVLTSALHWYGLESTEGVYINQAGEVDERGDFGPYTQSKRLPIYKEHVETLLNQGHAYRCFCTPERLAEMRNQQEAEHRPPRYDRHCLQLSAEDVEAKLAAGERFVIRHKIPAGQTVAFTDLIRGELSFQSDDLDDYVLLKGDGYPTYHLAVVVDDHLMQISHVLRGEEWLSSAPKHLLLFQAFGWQAPAFAHVPVILGPDGKKKLSKRDGAGSVQHYIDAGYLPEALLNFLVLLGWSPGADSSELMNLEDMVSQFKLEKVQKSPAKFDIDRLNQLNGAYIRQIPSKDLAEMLKPWLAKAGVTAPSDEALEKATVLVQERLKHFDEAPEFMRFFFTAPTTTSEMLLAKKAEKEEMLAALQLVRDNISNIPDWKRDGLEAFLRNLAAEHTVKPGVLFWGVRVALSGAIASPGVFELLEYFGPAESESRITAAISCL